MNWDSPYVVYRLTSDGKLEEVFKADDIKKARYWLTYIAQIGDVLCKTPRHPKHTQSSTTPEYFGHKAQSGIAATNEEEWKNYASGNGWNAAFPNEPQPKEA